METLCRSAQKVISLRIAGVQIHEEGGGSRRKSRTKRRESGKAGHIPGPESCSENVVGKVPELKEVKRWRKKFAKWKLTVGRIP